MHYVIPASGLQVFGNPIKAFYGLVRNGSTPNSTALVKLCVTFQYALDPCRSPKFNKKAICPGVHDATENEIKLSARNADGIFEQ